jgi:serine/threonine protein kinase
MENERPRPKTKGDLGKGKAANPPTPETKLGSATPEENDPVWEEMGKTRIVEGVSDAPVIGVPLAASAKATEPSTARILGKDILTLGDYQLIEKLGEGAMGAVWKAVEGSRKRTVALKVLFPHVANNPKLVQRLIREGQVMGQLDHPNIVQAFEVGEAGGYHYVAMEYISGQSMQKWLNDLGDQLMPVGDAVRITLDCARALAYAHAQGMVHRDIKPDNILLTKTGIVKVADLGMVKTHDEDMSLTQTGHAVGTPWYMPIEQARNSKDIDGRSDIYALGCTLYAFLTGQPPFVGRTIVDVIQAKEKGTFDPARKTNVNVPEKLDLYIARMTAKLPKNRYQTCDEVIKDLEGLGLASAKLSFLQQKPLASEASAETPMPGKTSASAAIAKSRADAELAEVAAPSVDPDIWYVQMKLPDGKVAARKYTTAQLKKLLAEGTMKITAPISHRPDEGFRAVGTYKEFQGSSAAGKLSKNAADKTTARYRGIYKKIEEADREKEKQEKADKREDSAVSANTRYWMSMAFTFGPIGIGIAVIVGFLYWMASMF